MSRRLKQAAVVFVILFAAAQFIAPERANPPTTASHTIRAHPGTEAALVAVLDRSCGDCHSNTTQWPWYTRVAPMSWLMAYGVAEGRKVVNFSEWQMYQPAQQHALLVQSCKAVSDGKMPGFPYTTLRPEARLSAHDIEIICAAARQVANK